MPIHFNHQIGPITTPLQHRAIKEAFSTLYAFCQAASEDHFLFTSSGAEAINHVVLAAYLDITRKTGKNHFLASSLEEAPAILAMSRLQECGCLFEMIPATTDGIVTCREFAEKITPRTAMVSVSWANGLTGVIQPVREISQVCKERGILLHVDATHVLGKGEYSIADCGADVVTFQTAIAGCGGLVIPAQRELSPFILGGSEQGGMRGGPYSIPLLLECAKWAKDERDHRDHYGTEVARLRKMFEDVICDALGPIAPLFHHQNRVPHITSFVFPGAHSDALCYLLLQKGVHTVCGGGHLQHFSHILKACGMQEPHTHCGISFGFAHSVVEEEVIYGAERVIETVLQLQKYSRPFMEEWV